jgi:hypothetical protein
MPEWGLTFAGGATMTISRRASGAAAHIMRPCVSTFTSTRSETWNKFGGISPTTERGVMRSLHDEGTDERSQKIAPDDWPLPAHKQEFGAESRTHGGDNA